jgi:glycogen operon protein
VRDFWRGEDSKLGEFASRLLGSSDLYEETGRRPFASINFVTAHDGFTLRDLVSYQEKRNAANGEQNRDGRDDNRSWNCGAEGESDDADVRALRARLQRCFLATLLLSQGVPMLVAGDELGRTQQGNNNAYCQDNEISWLDWEQGDPELLAFTARLVALRRQHPIFRRRRWCQGRPCPGALVADVAWFRPDGSEMQDEDWQSGFAKSLGIFLNGESIRTLDALGGAVADDSFELLFNAHHAPIDFRLPVFVRGRAWQILIDTAQEPLEPGRDEPCEPGKIVRVDGRSLVVLRRVA